MSHTRLRRPVVDRVGAWMLAVLVASATVLTGCDALITPGGREGGRAEADAPTPTPTVTSNPGSSPSPSPTETPLPGGPSRDGAEGVDPRCAAEYADVTIREYEGEIELRPEYWPIAPEFAAFCFWVRDDGNSAVAFYATDPGIVRAEIYRFYEHAFGDVGVHGRVDSDNGELLTGVYPPQHSYYIQFNSPNRYEINWAIDGDYADD